MVTHYILEVLRVGDVAWASSRPPNLYIKVKCGATVQKTQVIKGRDSPSWNTSIPLSTTRSPDVEDVRLELKNRSTLPWNRRIGFAVVSVEKLLAESANGEVKVQLHSPDSRQSSAITGILFLNMKAVEERQAVESMLETAESMSAMLPSSTAAAASDQVEKMQDTVAGNWGLLQSLIELAEQVDGFVKNMDKVATIHPYLNVTWQVLSSLQKAIKGQVDEDKEVVGLVRCMKETFETIKSLESLPDKLRSLDGNMVEFFKQSSECCTFIREYTGHGFMRRMVTVGPHDKIQQFRDRFSEIKAALTEGTTLHTAFVSARIMKRVDLTYLRHELNPTEMDASDRPQCLPGTRADVLTRIMDWMFSDMDTNMLWLHGVAGSGKSTVSTTISKYCFDMNRQGAHLFFVRGKSKPNTVIREIAFRLASFDPSIAEHVVAAVENNNGISEAPFESQFEKLLLHPLRAAADAMTGPVAVVLDALDECGSPDERTRLVKLLHEEFPKLPPVFRFIVASRPEVDLMEAFSTSHSVAAVPLDYTSESSKKDVFRYLDVEMRNVFRDQQQRVTLRWEETMEVLGKAADGLFIWASTAIKMVKQSDEPAEEVQDLVELCRSRRSGSQSGLIALYDAVLENSGIQWHKPRSRERFARILGLILFSKASITLRTIDDLLGCSSHHLLSRLACVLAYTPGNLDAPVRLFHTSFSDYLLAPERKEQLWFIDEWKQRLCLPARCFDVMADKLSFNICQLESSFVLNDKVPDLDIRIRERIPSDLQYACQYFAQHLCDVPQQQASSELLKQLSEFVQQHLLYWCEVLSLTNHFDHVASRTLFDVSLWTDFKWPDISSAVWDAYRFVSIFSYPMSRSAPHIYLSALSFGLHDHTVVKHYSNTLPVIRTHRFGKSPPQPCLKVFSDDTGSVLSVSFSPDGRRLASSSSNGTVLIWDVDSGKVVSGPFKGHEGCVNSVVFSPDGRHIASGSGDRTVCIWDVDSGKIASDPFKGHAGRVFSVAFSPDGRRIASASEDKTIRLWNVNSGKLAADPLQVHTGEIFSIAFLPDGRRVAFGSYEGIVRVWDTDSGEIASFPFEMRTHRVFSMAFSPDGRRVASGSVGTVSVWDMDSGKLVSGPFREHSDIVLSVAFSPDGRRVASSSFGRVSVCDMEAGVSNSGVFEGHVFSVNSVAFSPDGRRIASGSSEGTIRFWDVDSGEIAREPFERYPEQICSVVFSRDGRRILCGSADWSIRAWDVDSDNVVLNPPEGCTGSANSVVFVPDNAHRSFVSSVAFSLDRQHIAFGSSDKTVRIYDAGSAKISPLRIKRHWKGSIASLAFSPDGRRIASGSTFGTICVWDIDSDKIDWNTSERHGYRDIVHSVVFSPDGRHIASSSHDGKVLIWNADSLKVVSDISLTKYYPDVWSVAFSLDWQRLASGERDGTVSIWDVDFVKVIAGPFAGHTKSVISLAFSPDGRRIASQSQDGMIRICDVRHGMDMPNTIAEDTESKIEDVYKSDCDPRSSYEPPAQQRVMQPIREICRAPNWNISKDGWLLGKGGELIVWISEYTRRTLWHPATTTVLGCRFSTKLDFTDARLGEGWYEGYPRKPSE